MQDLPLYYTLLDLDIYSTPSHLNATNFMLLFVHFSIIPPLYYLSIYLSLPFHGLDRDNIPLVLPIIPPPTIHKLLHRCLKTLQCLRNLIQILYSSYSIINKEPINSTSIHLLTNIIFPSYNEYNNNTN